MSTETQLEAGRELDAVVQERVFGHHAYTRLGNMNGDGYGVGSRVDPLPHYSTDIAAAWEVLRHFTDQGYRARVDTTFRLSDGHAVGWFVDIGGCEARTTGLDTAPLAICIAAVEASRTPPEQEDA